LNRRGFTAIIKKTKQEILIKATQLIAFGALAFAMAISISHAQDAAGPEHASNFHAQKASKVRASLERFLTQGSHTPGEPKAQKSPEELQAAKAAKIRGALEKASHTTPGQAVHAAGNAIHSKLKAFQQKRTPRDGDNALMPPPTTPP
jgi:hypothetical protein